MAEFQLPSAEARLGIVTCAAAGCGSKGQAHPSVGPEGEIIPAPPAGWGTISAISGQGDELVLMICSQACQRRLARNLDSTRMGSLEG